MHSNDILRRLVKSLAWSVTELQAIFALSEIELTETEIAKLLKTDYEPGFEAMPDYVLIKFLDALIESKRGKREGAPPAEVSKRAKISNNEVLKKLRIAFNLQEQQLRDLLKCVTIELTKSDLSALFRKPEQAAFKACDDELLFDFIDGLGLWLQQDAQA